jgi:tRNA-dihydrouridine synthase B
VKNSEQLLNQLKMNPFVLAPMAGITDRPFRSFMKELGASIVVTELVSATGLRHSSQKTRKLMEFENTQHPVGIQIFGESLEDLEFAAKEVEQMGADFVDINFGCPVPKVVKKGAGSACLRDLPRLQEILKTVKSSVQIPVTIKVRTGWDANSMNTHEVAHIAYNEGITWVAIHGRTRAQGYSGEADWNYISEVKAKSPLPILGNGDLTSAEKANRAIERSHCDGVMIGRGCLKNPYIFEQALKIFSQQEIVGAETPLMSVFDRLYHHLSSFYDERLISLQLKKFGAWYSAGFPNSSEFRKKIFQSKDLSEVKDQINEYYGELKIDYQKDTSHESFLMGGHG